MEIATYVAIVFVCLLLSAFFSGSETALLRLTNDQIDRDIKKKPSPGVLAAKDLIKSSSKLLVTILMGNNVVNILAASCASSLAVYYLGDELGLVVSTIVMTLLVLIFAEILPKAVAANDPRLVAYNVALPLYIIHKISYPFHLLFDKMVDPLIKKIARNRVSDDMQSEDILRLAKQISARKSDGTPLPIIWSAAQAGSLVVEHIMTPKSEIFACSITDPFKEILDKTIEKRFTRVPIYEGSIDKILGSVHLKDLIRLERSNVSKIDDIINPVLRVPERKPILSLLMELQQENIHIAVVKDEFGNTVGLVTMEDILEELVGEIRDEFDQDELTAIAKVSENEFLVKATAFVSDFNKETGWAVPAGLGDTIAGYVFNGLGRIALKGDVFELNGYRVEVMQATKSRIVQVKISRTR